MIKIVQKEDVVLRKKTKEVPIKDITSKKIQTIIQNMKEALAKEVDGVALAAPQIGVSLSIFIISSKVFEFLKMDNLNFEEIPADISKDRVFINPVITNKSKKTSEVDEGCLSIRWWYGKVNRSEKATVRAYDEKGKQFTYGGSGLIAQIFQHEMDHLEGVLFTDKTEKLEEIKPEQ